jgi:hypothetical protein
LDFLGVEIGLPAFSFGQSFFTPASTHHSEIQMTTNSKRQGQEFTPHDFAMVLRAMHGRAVSRANREAASPPIRSLLSLLRWAQRRYPSEDHDSIRWLVFEGFLVALPDEVACDLEDHVIFSKDPGPTPRIPSLRVLPLD